MKQALTVLIVCDMTASAEAGPGQAATQRDRSAPRSRKIQPRGAQLASD